MKILIASPDNAVFRVISERASSNGHQVERDGSTDLKHILSRYGDTDYLLLNQTISFNRRLIHSIENREKIVDLSLSKAQLKGYRGQFISMAVLLTPPDENSDSECRILLAEDISPETASKTLSEILGSDSIESSTSDEIDSTVSEVLVKPYIMALLSRKVSDLDYEKPSGEYRMVQDLAKMITNYNIDQIRDLLRNSPDTGKTIASFEENVKRVWNELSNY